MSIFGQTPSPPPPPPPPAAPPTMASSQVAGAAARQQEAARQAAGAGFAGTLETGPQGAANPPTAMKALLGE